jgi:hypothetical protein
MFSPLNKVPAPVKGWRRFFAPVALGAAFILALVVAPAATALPAAAVPVVQVAPEKSPVPGWLLRSVQRAPGNALGKQILEGMGYTCSWDRPLCYHVGSYDPPRWGKGTVATPVLNARSAPNSSAPIVRTFPKDWKLIIFCQTDGERLDGLWGSTGTWNYIGRYNGQAMFVFDGLVNTGSNDRVAGDCAGTNMGDG